MSKKLKKARDSRGAEFVEESLPRIAAWMHLIVLYAVTPHYLDCE